MDYYLNIRARSKSKAPFNMWPHQLKFALTNPNLIYKAIIKDDGNIETKIFPTFNNSYIDKLKPLQEYSKAQTITLDAAKNVLLYFNPGANTSNKNKFQVLNDIENIRVAKSISNLELCNALADAIYLPSLINQKAQIPLKLATHYKELK